MKQKPTIRKMTPDEENEINAFFNFAIKVAEKRFPGNSDADKEENIACYHQLMDNEMIARGLRVRII